MGIKVDNISFSYGSNVVFDKFSCNINCNVISAIVGKNGCGKSTFLSLIDGLLSPINGYIKIGDVIVDGCSRKVGYLFQFSDDQVFNSTVYKEIEFGLKCFGFSNIGEKIRNSLELVGLDDSFLSLDPYKISNGERRKVAIASVLAYDPDIIILDEPTVGMDNRSKISFMKLLKSLKKDFGKTIIIVSHDINFLHKFVDYVYLIKDGEIFLEGNKYDVFSNEYAMNECGLLVPNLLHFSNIVLSRKNVKLGYRDDINDLIKDVYRYGKW